MLEGVSPELLGLVILILNYTVILVIFGLYKLIKYVLIKSGIVTKEQWETRDYDCFNDEGDD